VTRATFLVGDVFDVLDRLAADGTQVDLVLTSPPFAAVRWAADIRSRPRAALATLTRGLADRKGVD